MAVLRFKKPEIKQQRLKAMFYGEMGTGKSTCACQFPLTAYIDTEDTASKKKYAKMITENGGQVTSSGDIEEIIDTVKWLMSSKHEFKTLVIDSLTIPYENAVIDGERRVGTEFGRGIAEAKKKAKLLVNLLLKLDMNIIVTCQARKEYAGTMAVVGQTFSGYDRLGYMFDLVFETQIRGEEHFAVTKKSRLEEFPMRESFKFNYQEIIKRMGIDIIEKDVISQELASAEQVEEAKRLIDLFKVPEETYMKWLEKHQAEDWEELSAEIIQKIIDHLKSQVKGVAA
jgi:hypothetical protein